MPRLSLVPVIAALFLTGCSNALNPFCGNVRPAPLIGSLSPSTVTFAQVQQGVTLTVNGNQFVSASQLVVNGKTLGPTVISSQKLSILLTTGETGTTFRLTLRLADTDQSGKDGTRGERVAPATSADV